MFKNTSVIFKLSLSEWSIGVFIMELAAITKYKFLSNSHFFRTSLLPVDLDLFVVLRRVQQPGSYCDG